MLRFILLSSLWFVVGCAAVDAVDSVNQTPGKMDTMAAKMGNMEKQMNKTNEAIRLQKLAIAKENLEDPKNAEILTPLPFGLMGYAKLFAKTAKLEELVAQVYLYTTDIHDGLPAQTVTDDGTPVAWTAQQTAQINQYKSHRLAAMQAISSFLSQTTSDEDDVLENVNPETTIDEMIKKEIIGGGRYRETALSILMMRVQFNRKVMLESSLLAQEMTSVGTLEKAMSYLVAIEKIVELPFAREIKYDMYGFLPPMVSEKIEITPEFSQKMMTQLISKIKLRAKGLKSIQSYSWTGDVAQDKVQLLAAQKRADVIFNQLDQKLAYWKSKPL